MQCQLPMSDCCLASPGGVMLYADMLGVCESTRVHLRFSLLRIRLAFPLTGPRFICSANSSSLAQTQQFCVIAHWGQCKVHAIMEKGIESMSTDIKQWNSEAGRREEKGFSLKVCINVCPEHRGGRTLDRLACKGRAFLHQHPAVCDLNHRTTCAAH